MLNRFDKMIQNFIDTCWSRVGRKLEALWAFWRRPAIVPVVILKINIVRHFWLKIGFSHSKLEIQKLLNLTSDLRQRFSKWRQGQKLVFTKVLLICHWLYPCQDTHRTRIIFWKFWSIFVSLYKRLRCICISNGVFYV